MNNGQTLHKFDPIATSSDPRAQPPKSMETRPFTPRNMQTVHPILQPRPQRPIPIDRLTHASHPAQLIPIRAATGRQEPARQTFQRYVTPGVIAREASSFQFSPGPGHTRAGRAPESLATHLSRHQRSFTSLSNAVRSAMADQQNSTKSQAPPIHLTSLEDDTATDSGYAQSAVFNDRQSVSVQHAQRTTSPAPPSNPAAPTGGFTFYCGTGTQEPPKPRINMNNSSTFNNNGEGSGSVWNPNLANCTAAKPRRLTLKQENNFEEADRRYRSEAIRNSIAVVKDSVDARN